MAKIISLSEAVSIALHSMILIGRSNKESVNVDKLAEATGSSRHHVAKVMQRLAKDGFVGSHRGPHGGFYLLRDPGKIFLLEIYESIEGKLVPATCPMDKQVCAFDKCFLNNITYELTVQFIQYMKSQSLANFF
jgi:Rrf2 family transcriptional regulator, nitric oxide-sensitive transcriptional repressor